MCYLIIPMSTTNLPMPRMGGSAINKETPHINCRLRDEKNFSEVVANQDPSFLTTDLHLAVANNVIVYRQLIPVVYNNLSQ